MGFRENLKEEMEYQGLTTKELGKRTLDHYLMVNPQEPGVYNAQKIAKALKVSVEYLVTGKEYKSTVAITGEKLDFLNSFQKLPVDERLLILNLIKKLEK